MTMVCARRLVHLIALGMLILAALACNLIKAPSVPVTVAETPTTVPGGMPQVTILWPPTGSEFVVRREVTVHVTASDSVGITRLELRAPGIMLASVASPERAGQTTMEAILSWTPTRSGAQDLEVLAYRRGVGSEPVPLQIVIRSRAAEVIFTPVPFGVAPSGASVPPPGAICQVRVNITNLRYRSGPDTNAAILGLLELGETLAITGRNSSGTWYRADRGGQTVWLSANPGYITELSSCAAAPIVS
jgi:hypothetical protein